MGQFQKAFIFSIICGFVFATANAEPNGTGIFTGRVIDEETGDPLPGANVMIEGTRLGGTTDNAGRFRVVGVPDGPQILIVTYLGYQGERIDITSIAGQTASTGVIGLRVTSVEMEPLIVEGIRQGQARALNQQMTAVNIKNIVSADLVGRFPDPNVAEALQRIPGVSVQRDQGEGRYVMIRGTEPRLTSVMIDGEQIPSPEGHIRNIALDVIPADLLASIEVNKPLTPGMDADGIGGAVNVITKQAYDARTIFNATVASGYNNLVSDSNIQGAFTYGKRVGFNGGFGYLFSGSYYRTDRGSDNNEHKWGTEDFGIGALKVLTDYQIRDYLITRERTGLVGNVDYRFGKASSVYFRGIFNRFGDQEYQRRLRFRFGKGTYDSEEEVTGGSVERKLKDRYEEQDIYSFKAGGAHAITDLAFNYSLSYSYAREKEPGRKDITFEQKNVDLAYDLSDPQFPVYSITNGKDIFDSSAFSFKELELEDDLTWERNLTARFDLKIPYRFDPFPGAFKVGSKFRIKDKERSNNYRMFEDNEGELSLEDVAGKSESRRMHDDRYTIGQSPDPDRVRKFYVTNRGMFQQDIGESREVTDSENYEASEKVYALYSQVRSRFRNLRVLLGMRYENTHVGYNGNKVDLDTEGDYVSTQKVDGRNTYGYLFPMAHLRYGLTPNTNIRLAWTRSLARPNYYDLVPYQVIDREDEMLERGNTKLKPTTAMNLDFMAEHYFQSVGVVSVGIFHKRLDGYIHHKIFKETGGIFNGYGVRQPQNGGGGTLVGGEITWQQQFTSLPGALKGLGLLANYTYTYSRAEVIGFSKRPGRTKRPPIPGQTPHIGNLGLSYEKSGFSSRAALNFRGAFIQRLSQSAADDIYSDKHIQLDLSASQRVGPKTRLFLELINLTNTPLRFYRGSSDRPIQQEYYSWWGHFGLKYDL